MWVTSGHIRWIYMGSVIILLLSYLVLVMPSSEKKLIKKLVDNYERIGKIGRPVRQTRETIVVGFGLALFQILDFNEKEQVITINVWSKYVGMNIFVAFSVLLKLLAQSTPSASVIVPRLGYFYCLNMTLIGLSTFSSTMVIKLHFRSQKYGPVPNWLLKIVYHLSDPLSIGLPEEDEDVTPTLSQLETELRNSTAKAIRFQPCFPYSPGLTSEGKTNPADHQMLPFNPFYPGRLPPTLVNRWGLGRNHLLTQADGLRAPMTYKTLYLGGDSTTVKNQNPRNLPVILDREKLGNSLFSLQKTGGQDERSKLHSVKVALQNVMIKVMKKDLEAKRSREWRLVTMTIDRLIFWLYMTIIIVSVSYLLIPRGDSRSVEHRIDTHSNNYLEYNNKVTNNCPKRLVANS